MRLVAALLVEVRDHLGVAVRAEGVARLEVGAQLPEVVDLAVEHDLDASRPRWPGAGRRPSRGR